MFKLGKKIRIKFIILNIILKIMIESFSKKIGGNYIRGSVVFGVFYF